MLEPPDLGALIRKVVPPRANHFAAAAAQSDIPDNQPRGDSTITAPNSTAIETA